MMCFGMPAGAGTKKITAATGKQAASGSFNRSFVHSVNLRIRCRHRLMQEIKITALVRLRYVLRK